MESGDAELLQAVLQGKISLHAARKCAKAKSNRFPGDTDERYSPDWLVEKARLVLGGIDCDPASSELANRTVAAATYYTRTDDGLQREWRGRVWLNFPWSHGFALGSEIRRGTFGGTHDRRSTARARRDGLVHLPAPARRLALVSSRRSATTVPRPREEQVGPNPVSALARLLRAERDEVRVRLRGGRSRVPGGDGGPDRGGRNGAERTGKPDGDAEREDDAPARCPSCGHEGTWGIT